MADLDMELVKDRLMKGAFVGIGSFVSTFAENAIEKHLFDSDIAVGVAQLGVGAGVSLGADMVFDQPDAVPNNAVEFAGYGIQGSAWSNLADSLQTGAPMGSGRTVTVRQASSGGETETTSTGQSYSLDTA